MFNYYCLNPIAQVGLEKFKNNFVKTENVEEAEGILVRSAAMHDMELSDKLLAVARAGAGVNNIPLDKCAQKGIVVFNTPGANANGVKELVFAGMLLAARDVVPAHHDRFREHPQANLIPAEALGNNVDAHFLQKFHTGKQYCLPGRIPGGIHAGKLRLKTILFHNTVTVSICPTSVGQKLLCVIHIGLNFHSRIVPGHAVVFRERGSCVAVQCHIRNDLAVNGIGDGLADFYVAGNVVADGCAVLSHLTFGRKHGQGESPAVSSSNSFNVIAIYLVHCQGCGGNGCIYLSCLDSCQGA